MTTHARHRFVLDRFPVFCFDEIPARAVVANQTSGLPAGKQELLRNFDRDSWNHLLVMLITKYVKVVAPHSSQPFLVTWTGASAAYLRKGKETVKKYMDPKFPF